MGDTCLMRSRGAMKGITSVALGFFVLGLINGCAGPSRSEVSANAEPIEPPVSMAAEQSTALVLDEKPEDPEGVSGGLAQHDILSMDDFIA